jgi:hypothetical protein
VLSLRSYSVTTTFADILVLRSSSHWCVSAFLAGGSWLSPRNRLCGGLRMCYPVSCYGICSGGFTTSLPIVLAPGHARGSHRSNCFNGFTLPRGFSYRCRVPFLAVQLTRAFASKGVAPRHATYYSLLRSPPSTLSRR